MGPVPRGPSWHGRIRWALLRIRFRASRPRGPAGRTKLRRVRRKTAPPSGNASAPTGVSLPMAPRRMTNAAFGAYSRRTRHSFVQRHQRGHFGACPQSAQTARSCRAQRASAHTSDGPAKPHLGPVTKVTVTIVTGLSKNDPEGACPFWVISRGSIDHRSGLAASGARRARDAADPNGPRAARSERSERPRALGTAPRELRLTKRSFVSRAGPRPKLVVRASGTARRPLAPCDRRLREA